MPTIAVLTKGSNSNLPQMSTRAEFAMKLPVSSTIFGQLVRFFSSNKTFQYPDEIDPSSWQNAVHQDDIHRPGLQNDNDQANEEEAFHEQHIENEEVSNGVVGWYGPEDPEVTLPPPTCFP